MSKRLEGQHEKTLVLGEGPVAYIVVDLGFGDQGKGTITDFLVRDRGAGLVVRYNGGAQAAHRVVTDDGRRHTFAQLGAGSFVQGVLTFLSRHVAISPWAMLVEVDYLARAGVTDAFARTLIAAGAPVITPFHRAANRLRERARGPSCHGSCGIGLGETVADARALGAPEVVRAGDLVDLGLRTKLRRIQARKRAELAQVIDGLRGSGEREAAQADVEVLEDPASIDLALAALLPFMRQARIVSDDALHGLLARTRCTVFEGAHGVLLDEDHGFHPFTTWSSCTTANALALLRAASFGGEVTRLGVLRAYATRHGPGPLPTEAPALAEALPEPQDFARPNPWQGPFRVGWFDAVSARYAIAATGGIDLLAVTCVDRVAALPAWHMATAYDLDGRRESALSLMTPGDLEAQAALGRALTRARPVYRTAPPTGCLEAIGEELGPVALRSDGPTAKAKKWLIDPTSSARHAARSTAGERKS